MTTAGASRRIEPEAFASALRLDAHGTREPDAHVVAMAGHEARRARLLERFALLVADRPSPAARHLGLGRTDTHLFRPRARGGAHVPLEEFNHVLAIDPETRRAVVEGGASYETLVAATLPFGLVPAVTPELKTITVGGAVAGVGVESSSHREGLVHDTVEEMDVLTASGAIVSCSPDRDADLFAGLPNSYGTLGYALRLVVRLVSAPPLVVTRNLRFSDPERFVAAMVEAAEAAREGRDWANDGPPDFVDGVVFSRHEQALVLGRFAATGPVPSDYTGGAIYYRSLRTRERDALTVHDYLWRWDTDWFWCSRHFGMEHPLLRRLVPRRWRGSHGYNPIRRWALRAGLSPGAGQESVVQDIAFRPEAAAEFLGWFLDAVPITPIWVCPFTPRRVAPLFPLDPGTLHLDVAFWDSVPAGDTPAATNRRIEEKALDLHGLKSLYSRSYYAPDVFDRLYGGDAYRALKSRYDPDGLFGHRDEKCLTKGES